jgi:hypothetical protein
VTYPSATPSANSSHPGVPKKLAEFLVEFAVAVQKHAIYPQGHPQLATAVEKCVRRLDGILADAEPVTFAFARDQVVIDSVATDPANALMRELSQRMHRQRIGSIGIRPGVLRDELADFLYASSIEETEKPQIAIAAQTMRWPHIHVTTLTYEKLELMGDESGLTDDENKRAGAKLIWIALARATLMLGADPADETLLSPLVLAGALKEKRDPGYDQSVVGFLLELTESLKGPQSAEAIKITSQLTELIKSLQPAALDRLLEMGGDAE